MIYTDLNPAAGMGANCSLIEIGPFKLVIDSGINPKEVGVKAIPELHRLDDHTIDLAIITHCHLDHLGALPLLVRQIQDTQVIMSIPSEILYQRMLHNSVNVMRRQREEHYIPEYPLYNHEEVDRLTNHVHPIPFRKSRILEKQGEELSVTLHSSGHVVGAAGIEIVYKHRRIFFTGDVLFSPQSILPAARFPQATFDTLIMETTRGATEVDPYFNRNEEVKKILESVRTTIHGGGSVLIPVFALGRMQEILNLLHKARLRGDIPTTPIYSSGLGMELSEYIDKITKRTELCTFTTKVIRELRVKPVKNLRPGKRVPLPGIFVCSSGMMVELTPSWKVAASLLPFHENSICFVGYCDPDTPAGKLLNTKPGESFLFDSLRMSLPLRARIRKFDLSGHANRDELMSFATASEPRSVVLTHGDSDARAWFAKSLGRSPGPVQITIPQPFEPCLV
ncbi:MAG: MBL fold metallo-hydrolase [Verrucomicrobia bacterium]|nr:MBL fold metallo-hydrolase [Verrucomicrobiota bacterium]